MNMHTSMFIKPQRAGQVLRIHAQANFACAASIKFIERMTQQGKSKPAFSPWAAHTQRSYPTHFGVVKGLGAAKVYASDLIPVYGKNHQGGIGAFILPEVLKTFQAFFKGLLHEAEMVLERVLHSAIDSRSICPRVIGAESDAYWKFRRRYGCIHLDQHVIGATDVMVAHIRKQSLWFFRLLVGTQARSKTQSSRYVGELLQRALLCPMQYPCANAEIFISGVNTSPHPRVDWRFDGRPHFGITGQLAIRREDQADICPRVKARRGPFVAEGLCVRDFISPDHRTRPAVKEHQRRFNIIHGCSTSGEALGQCHHIFFLQLCIHFYSLLYLATESSAYSAADH